MLRSTELRARYAYQLQGLTLKRHIEATLGSGNIREAVRLPPGEDLCEWLAVNTVDFYNALSVLYGTLEEFCTKQSCPVMTAGPKVYPLSRTPDCMNSAVLHGRPHWDIEALPSRCALTEAWCAVRVFVGRQPCQEACAPVSARIYQHPLRLA